jgi:hypothetical protein
MGGDQDDAVGSASPLHVPFSAVRARALPIPAHGAGPSLLWEPSDGSGAGGCDRCRCTCGGVRRGRTTMVGAAIVEGPEQNCLSRTMSSCSSTSRSLAGDRRRITQCYFMISSSTTLPASLHISSAGIHPVHPSHVLSFCSF